MDPFFEYIQESEGHRPISLEDDREQAASMVRDMAGRVYQVIAGLEQPGFGGIRGPVAALTCAIFAAAFPHPLSHHENEEVAQSLQRRIIGHACSGKHRSVKRESIEMADGRLRHRENHRVA